ncbi:MAG: hypothetical protein JXR94_10955 [Candidatus Hydrogenedentes bacterium]|nr:hypothetical protein [Candidatus Hydrogenedentota bacterium]
MAKAYRIVLLAFAGLFCSRAWAVEWTPTLENTPNLHTTTLTITLNAKPGAAQAIPVELHNLAESVWTANVSAGQSTLSPEDFECTAPGKIKEDLVFGYVTKITAPDNDVASMKVAWAGDDGVRYPWESDPAPVGKEDGGATIWPGLHRNNAGHFSWRYEPNGLLTDSVSFDGIARYYHRLASTPDAFWQFHFVIPDALGPGRMLASQANENAHMSGRDEEVRVEAADSVYNPKDAQVDWTSFRWTRKARVAGGKEYTTQLRYGAMALGVQVETDSPELAVGYGPAGKGGRNLFLAMPTADGLQIARPGEPIDPRAMSQNWLVMVDGDGAGSIPVMLIFQYRPDALSYQATGLTISRASGVGTIAIGAPFGVRVLPLEDVQRWRTAPGTIPTEELIAFRPFLMAYPWACRETFSVSNGQVHIRDAMTFLPWEDDWGTQFAPSSPIPPMVAWSVHAGYLPKTSIKNIQPTGIDTRYGPYWVGKGDEVDYALPIPRAYDNFPIRCQPPDDLAWLATITRTTLAGLDEFVPTEPSSPQVWTHALTFDHTAGAWRAANYLTPDERARFRTASRQRILGGLMPQNFRLRVDPLTGAKYMGVSFVWYGKEGPWGTFDLDRPNCTGYNDLPFWLGVNLYGIYTQAKYNAAWDLIRSQWPTVRSLVSYYENFNSWALMDPGSLESGGFYHADMPTAGYAGLVGYYYLAKQLGTPYQKDLGAYLLARSAVPMGCKLGFRAFMEQSGIRHLELVGKALPAGFGEDFAVSLHTPIAEQDNWGTSDPWWETGCLGPQSGQPEAMDLFLERCLDDLDTFERIFMETCANEQFAENDDVRVIPHVMVRTRLGGELRRSGAELVQLQNRPQYLPRDAHAFAEILSADCPVQLIDWAPGYIEDASWDATAATARIAVDGGGNGCTVKIISRASPVGLALDGTTVGEPIAISKSGEPRPFEVAIPAGKHTIQLICPAR